MSRRTFMQPVTLLRKASHPQGLLFGLALGLLAF